MKSNPLKKKRAWAVLYKGKLYDICLRKPIQYGKGYTLWDFQRCKVIEIVITYKV